MYGRGVLVAVPVLGIGLKAEEVAVDSCLSGHEKTRAVLPSTVLGATL